ncbi:MAG: hypothetical protein ABW321_03875, partial [Polyangiales bacterium]
MGRTWGVRRGVVGAWVVCLLACGCADDDPHAGEPDALEDAGHEPSPSETGLDAAVSGDAQVNGDGAVPGAPEPVAGRGGAAARPAPATGTGGPPAKRPRP